MYAARSEQAIFVKVVNKYNVSYNRKEELWLRSTLRGKFSAFQI